MNKYKIITTNGEYIISSEKTFEKVVYYIMKYSYVKVNSSNGFVYINTSHVVSILDLGESATTV